MCSDIQEGTWRDSAPDDESNGPTHERIKNMGGKSIFVHCDVTKPESVENAVKTVVKEYGRLDVMISKMSLHRLPAAGSLTDHFRQCWLCNRSSPARAHLGDSTGSLSQSHRSQCERRFLWGQIRCGSDDYAGTSPRWRPRLDSECSKRLWTRRNSRSTCILYEQRCRRQLDTGSCFGLRTIPRSRERCKPRLRCDSYDRLAVRGQDDE